MNRDQIENFPSYPKGILGPELGTNMATQVMNYGAEILLSEVQGIEIQETHRVLKTDEGDYCAKAIILAGGAHPRKLGIPGEEKYLNKGVFYCATCDGPGFANKVVAVAGGGDSGITEALFMTRYGSKVIVLELIPHLTATQILQERAYSNPNIEIRCGIKTEAILGDEKMKALRILEMKTGEKTQLEADGFLIHIGIEPNTAYLRGSLSLDEKGQIIVNERMETEIPGVFAAGDIRENSPWQIATAVGDGATAAISLIKYLGNR